jgi:C_GCAxxG_C_C family probable redox protein
MAVDIEFLKKEILSRYGYPGGPNCAECMFMYAVKTLIDDVPPELVRIATPFGGGICRSEDVCGTLIGGMMVIGLKYGRRTMDGDKYRTYAIGKVFYDWFKNEFKSTNCRELNFSDYESEEHRSRCAGTFIVKSIQFLDSFFEKIDSGEWKFEQV